MTDERSRLIAAVRQLDGLLVGKPAGIRYVSLADVLALLTAPAEAQKGATVLGSDPVCRTWRDAAMRLGEELASDGPVGYYQFTPEQWLTWARETLKGGEAHGTRSTKPDSVTGGGASNPDQSEKSNG